MRDTSEWPPERTERVKKLWARGLSASQIAADLGLTRNAVIGKISRLKLPKRLQDIRPQRRPKAPRALPVAKAKRVTLPPLPINQPAIVGDAPPTRAEAWRPLPGTTPKRLADLGDIGRPDRPGECRWPIGENPTLFCACATEATYCAVHAAMARRRERVA